MATIRVNSTVMREKASAFKTVANAVKTYTGEMLTEIDSLRSTWEGESAETAVNKFKSLSDNFEATYNAIISYADFLEQAAQAYDDVENANLQGNGGSAGVKGNAVVGQVVENGIGTAVGRKVVDGGWVGQVGDAALDAAKGVMQFFKGW